MNSKDLKVKALRDIWAFADLIGFRGGSKSFYKLHREMAELNTRQQVLRHNKREYRRRLFLVPREHRKSTVNTVLYCLWRIYRNPDIRIVVACNVKPLAQDFIREIRAYLEDENLIDNVWNSRPHIKGQMIPRLSKAGASYKQTLGTEAEDPKVVWSNWAIQVVRSLKDKQPTLMALSVGMSAAGKHCDLVILDDLVDYKNSNSPEKAAAVKQWAADIESVLTKRATLTEICPGFSEWVGNEIIINGTRYFSWDLYSHYVGNTEAEMQERIGITKYSIFFRDVYVNGKDNSDGYICPEIFNEESEEDLLATESMSAKMFAAQYRNKIIADTDVVMTNDQITTVMHTNYKRTSYTGITNFLDQTKPTINGPTVYPIRLFMVVDLAVSQRSTADSSGYAIGGYDSDHRLHLVAAEKGRWKPTQHYEKICKAAEHWNVQTVHYESGVGYQESFNSSFKAWIKQHNKRPLFLYGLTQSRTISKNDRIVQTLQPLFSNESVYISSIVINRGDLKREIQLFNPALRANQDDLLDMLEMLARISKAIIPKTNAQYERQNRTIAVNSIYGGCR